MTTSEAIAIFSAIIALAAVVGWGVTLSFKMGTLFSRVDTLWEIIIQSGVLAGTSKRLIKRKSPWVVSEEGEKVLPDDMKALLKVRCILKGKLKSLASGDLGPLVVETVGVEKLAEVAEKNNLGIEEVVALLVGYCRLQHMEHEEKERVK